ncbi:potassium channel family protein [Haloglycomyces albus]|uniref:potassium channel family protein n=1 Tax=Haloglycomyces albus TaxID=526067 RepID=UPI00046CC8A9|nr:potassium channel family protein [Haloglycomyces albus]
MAPEDARTKRSRAPWPDRLRQWEHNTTAILMVLAVLFLLAYATRVLAPGLPDTVRQSLIAVDILIWTFFALEYLWRLRLAGRGRRIEYMVATPLEAVTVLLPPARPLRLLRATILILELIARHTQLLVRTRMSFLVIGSIGMMLFLSSLAVLDAERDANSNINTWTDAMWWSFVTVTTVGYGDYTPVTLMGRIIAVVLMVVGIGLFGFVAATLASWITDKMKTLEARNHSEDEAGPGELEDEVHALRKEIAELRKVLSQQQHNSAVPDQNPGTNPTTTEIRRTQE